MVTLFIKLSSFFLHSIDNSEASDEESDEDMDEDDEEWGQLKSRRHRERQQYGPREAQININLDNKNSK